MADLDSAVLVKRVGGTWTVQLGLAERDRIAVYAGTHEGAIMYARTLRVILRRFIDQASGRNYGN